jgi:hypothetical protein
MIQGKTQMRTCCFWEMKIYSQIFTCEFQTHSRRKQRVMIMDEQESDKEDGLIIEEGSEDSEDEAILPHHIL